MTSRQTRARARTTAGEPDFAAYVEARRTGASERRAESVSGVSRDVIRNHPEWGPRQWAAREEYLEQQRAIVDRISRGEIEDPQQARVMLAAATWALERGDRETYGPSNRQEVSGPNGAPIQATVVRFPVNTLGALPEPKGDGE